MICIMNNIYHFKKKFKTKCLKLKQSFLEISNAFEESLGDLLSLNGHIVMDEKGLQALNSIEEKGLILYQTLVKEYLVDKSKSLFAPIKEEQHGNLCWPKEERVEQMTL